MSTEVFRSGGWGWGTSSKLFHSSLGRLWAPGHYQIRLQDLPPRTGWGLIGRDSSVWRKIEKLFLEKKRRRGRKQLRALSLSQKIVWGPVNPICCQGLPKQWRNRVDPGRALMLPMGIAQNRFSVNGSIARGIIQPALLMKWVGTSDHFSHLGISSSCYRRICLKNKPPAMVICKAMYHLSLNSFSFLSFQGTN